MAPKKFNPEEKQILKEEAKKWAQNIIKNPRIAQQLKDSSDTGENEIEGKNKVY